MKQEDKNLEGLGGWLILVGIGIVITPLRLGALLLKTFPPIFSGGIWEALTTPGYEAYSPLWAPILLSEIVINTGLILVSLYLLYLFFSKRRGFPKWYIGILVFSLIFIVIDAWMVKLIMPNEPMFGPNTLKAFLQALAASLIWIPYMLISKRVKATFVN
ncbi:MAG: DUF2569 domain-containing protein [Nitrospirae bacterium]|nr:DUF2569 domain-containing protein [Nitrospirota bacterium]